MSRDGDRAGGIPPEDYFRVLVEQAADGIFISTENGRYVHVNGSGSRLLGYEYGELTGKNIADVLPASELPGLKTALDAIGRGQVVTREWEFACKDGTPLDAEVRAHRLSSGLVLAIVRDLRQRKSIERQIRNSEAQLRSTLETAPDTILTVDHEGKVLFVNRTYPPLTPESVVGTSCYDYVPEESRPRVRAALDRVFSRGELDEYEVQGPPDEQGQRPWSSVRAGPVFDGERVVAATLCASDVSKQRRHEEETRELASRLHKIASQVPGMVYQYKLRADGSSCFPYASDGIRDVYRVTPDEVREDASKVFAILHPEDYQGIVDSITTSARTMQPWLHEYRVKFPDGDVRWLYGNSIPEGQADGSILWHGFITDITRRKEADRLKAALEEQLRQTQKVESIGRLAGGVAHDFNNLLTSLMGFVELALANLPKASGPASYLEGAMEAARRGATLTQQLLAFARKKIVHPELVSLNRVLERMAPLLRRLVSENLELVLAPAGGLGLVKVDVGSIEQVIMNLVVNARDAIVAASGTGRITLETQNVHLDAEYCRTHAEAVPGDYVVLAVSDTGVGMTPEVLARVFEPFFTTKPTGEGTGLGLAMCHGIVKQAGGNVSIYSEPGAGTTVRVLLPRAEGKEAAAPASAPAPEPARGHETILLVEDDPLILRVATVSLEKLGYRVLSAPDGVRALELVDGGKTPIDLVITDVVMPRMGGRELAEKVAARRPGVRVLFSSGYTENAIVHQGVLSEGIEFLQKPYSPSALTARVREVLDKKR